MWGWIFVFVSFALLLYLYLLKRELRRLKNEVAEIPKNAGYGSRLFVDLREKTILELVDELNQMIDAFEEQNRQVKKMEENVKLSIAGLSHDLRTPLTSIHGYVQLLGATSDDEKKAQYLKIVEHSVQRLMEMTDHFYDLARIETNQKDLALTKLSFSQLVEEILLSSYEQFEEKRIHLLFPEHPVDTTVIADPLLLTRVIQNIVQNLLRYAKSQAVLSYEVEADDLAWTVTNDLKPGSKVAIEKVFTRFYTEVASRTNTEASGLGLYLSKKIVERMNGKMDAKLEEDQFILTVRLPIHRVRL